MVNSSAKTASSATAPSITPRSLRCPSSREGSGERLAQVGQANRLPHHFPRTPPVAVPPFRRPPSPLPPLPSPRLRLHWAGRGIRLSRVVSHLSGGALPGISLAPGVAVP